MVEQNTLAELFHKCEKRVIGYENYENCEQEHFAETLKDIQKLVDEIQREACFSPNEELKDIQTENMKMLMVPYLEAEVLFRLMDDRAARVKQAHTYYLEYLKLMRHYDLLEKQQELKLKSLLKLVKDGFEDSDKPKGRLPMEQLQAGFEDRDTKIANYKLKKHIEGNLDRLKDYKDEDMKREFYKVQIQFSIMNAFDQLAMADMEVKVLAHQMSLTPEQHKANDIRSAKTTDLPPMQVQYIGVSNHSSLMRAA